MRIYEIDTAAFLAGRRLEEVDWSFLGPVDAVWLMGVWARSPAGREITLRDGTVMAAIRAALPDVTEADVLGSPYCVRDYVVDPRFGSLAAAREALADRGVKLILDYVPNHVAPDHPWVTERPELLIHGTERDLARDPAAWLRVGGRIVARGRDPYFPPWGDVVQLNAFAPGLRDAARELLADLARQCDGLRCDMAMLMTNDVFARTWNRTPPESEFWPDVLRDDLIFIAEVYWDMEHALLQQGFDYCYDKRLYDRLVHDDAAAVRAHLRADVDHQRRLVRFIENHDEPRAATALGPRARAAAVVMSTVPGARLYHHGQLDGLRTHVPIFLARGPAEEPDPGLRAFYERLLELEVRDWRLLETEDVLAWSFAGHVVAVNFSDAPVHTAVPLPTGDAVATDLDAWGTVVLRSDGMRHWHA